MNVGLEYTKRDVGYFEVNTVFNEWSCWMRVRERQD